MNLDKIDVSVIICCYNSVNRIVPTLEYLFKQKICTLSCELVIVDNNCSDNTAILAKELWNSLGNPFPMVVVSESKPGLSYARKKGVIAAQGEILVFCDDDNWLSSNYLHDAYSLMKLMPKIGIIGGWSKPVFEIEKPYWFDEVSDSFACGGYTNENLEPTLFVWGAGMVIRNEIASEIFKNNLVLEGRSGEILTAGDDTEICERVVTLGYEVYKSNKLFFEHFITKERLTIDYLRRLYIGFGYSSTKKSFIEYNKPMKYLTIHLVRTIYILSNILIKFLKNNSKKKRLLFLDFFLLKGNWKFLNSYVLNKLPRLKGLHKVKFRLLFY